MLSFEAGRSPSVFVRQQNRPDPSIAHVIGSFGDDPMLLADRFSVGGEDAGVIEKGVVIRPTFLLVDIAPLVSGMALEELRR